MTTQLARREFLVWAAGGVGTTLLVACSGNGSGSSGSEGSAAGNGGGTAGGGSIEGPTIVLDRDRFPTRFNEAPELAELVRAGQLPPVDERIGQDPLVVEPLDEIGSYGGVIRRAFTGPADIQNGNRFCAGPDNLLYWDYQYENLIPNIARDFEVSDGGRVTTLTLRRGMHWSDGEPFTADDIVFWFDDLYLNDQVVSAPSSTLTVDGAQGTVTKIDTHTVEFRFPGPHPLFPELLAGFTDVGGQSLRGLRGLGSFAPAHYLQQFHPRFTSEDAANSAAQAAGYESWDLFLLDRNSWHLNPELPVVTPWTTRQPNNTQSWLLERNPYSIWVDTEGNQLPYIDRIEMRLVGDPDVLNLQASSGDYDFQDRHVELESFPVLRDGEGRGGYRVHLDPGQNGADAQIQFNLSYAQDAEVGELIRTTDFRRALSLGIDRDQVNEVMFLGTGRPGSDVPAAENKYFPGEEWVTKWARHDPDEANELLDAIGLDQRDSGGFRLRRDGSARLRLELAVGSGGSVDQSSMAELVVEHWKDIGIQADMAVQQGSLVRERARANELQLNAGTNSGSEDLFVNPQNVFPSSVIGIGPATGVLYARWFLTNGQEGEEPPAPLPEIMEMFRQGFGAAEEERIEIGKEIWRMVADQVYAVGVVGVSPAGGGVRVVNANLGNVPERVVKAQAVKSPANVLPQTLYYRS